MSNLNLFNIRIPNQSLSLSYGKTLSSTILIKIVTRRFGNYYIISLKDPTVLRIIGVNKEGQLPSRKHLKEQ